jgi:universal stress protein A
MGLYQHIVCATDFSALSKPAIAEADALAVRLDATLHLLHVIEDQATQALAARASGLTVGDLTDEFARRAECDLRSEAARCRAPVITACAVGRPAAAIIDYAERHHADLLVAGTHGRGGIATVLLGSVAENLVRHAPCPILLIRSGVRCSSAIPDSNATAASRRITPV